MMVLIKDLQPKLVNRVKQILGFLILARNWKKCFFHLYVVAESKILNHLKGCVL
uniref:Uncharacterized protein n=1 Tax=Arundo donax TaxID=35708 RepID=A0A0A8YMS3_ARUDO